MTEINNWTRSVKRVKFACSRFLPTRLFRQISPYYAVYILILREFCVYVFLPEYISKSRLQSALGSSWT